MIQIFSKKNKNTKIYAPMDGEILNLDVVDDPLFSGRVMGDGIAIHSSACEVCAPADGVVSAISKTNHAIGLTLASNVELLIHIGVETQKLSGEEFSSHVKMGDTVKQGDSLLSIHHERMNINDHRLMIPIIVLNPQLHRLWKLKTGIPAINGETVLFEVS